METRRVETAPGMVFDVSVGGASEAALVLMLHGFGVSRHSWTAQMSALAEAGYFTAAPNQRGYSVGARPDPAVFANYRLDLVIADALEIAATLGYGERRFHLAGHDWGGSLAWEIADRYPERLASLTILSRPHPLSFNRALQPGSRSATAVGAPFAVSRSRGGGGDTGERRAVVAYATECQWRAAAGDRDASVGDRQSGGDGGGAGVVSRARCAPRAGGADESADAVCVG